MPAFAGMTALHTRLGLLQQPAKDFTTLTTVEKADIGLYNQEKGGR